LSTLCLILGDQLSLNTSSLTDINKKTDHVLLAEVRSEASYVKHHKQKIAFVFSAMRHFAQTLVDAGYSVSYVKYDDKNNRGSLFEEVKHVSSKLNIAALVLAKPAEYRLSTEVDTWSDSLDLPVTITPDNRFMASEDDFVKWADGKKQFRMEFFYREMRKRFNILMDDKQPVGGKWNFDADNRQKLPADFTPPAPTTFTPDSITESVISLVNKEFNEHFGDLDNFHYAVNREQALHVLDEFIELRLAEFGTYQDAMVQDEAWMYHSHVSFYINVGLITPEEAISAAQKAYYDGNAPISSV